MKELAMKKMIQRISERAHRIEICSRRPYIGPLIGFFRSRGVRS